MKYRYPILYLNENIPVRLVDILSSMGIPSVHTVYVGNQGVSDETQLEYASDNGYIMVTHNRYDFRLLHKRWIRQGKVHSGILVMSHGEPEYLAYRLDRFFDEIYPFVKRPFCLVPPD